MAKKDNKISDKEDFRENFSQKKLENIADPGKEPTSPPIPSISDSLRYLSIEESNEEIQSVNIFKAVGMIKPMGINDPGTQPKSRPGRRPKR